MKGYFPGETTHKVNYKGYEYFIFRVIPPNIDLSKKHPDYVLKGDILRVEISNLDMMQK